MKLVHKRPGIPKARGTIISIVILLLMLPFIMVNLWSSMSYWQHLGIVILGIMIDISLRALFLASRKR